MIEMNTNGMGRFEERLFDSVVCPKPRRIALFNSSAQDHIRIFSWSTNCCQTEIADSQARTELLDLILNKGGYGGEKSNNQVASSPPFFCGSPPSRASNPVIEDDKFNKKKQLPTILSPSPSSRTAASGCVRMKFGHKPAAVRIEGFDCLNRDRRNCSISAVA
ncbi:uncharacterized protein LOC111291349 [Durio zibethinus]|uniref:Uncharacterized protein LOC111291349 n=1 Tax=Durio zibethinus TaxID=66656 RepID=A0A6P5YFC6_DURZI|nr:uncharacterized protein LOC111291349 [Durio zibethinus]XP_022738762.1 uncharacterized protein LOC111291349 [Durio zibethinus]